MPTQKVWYPEGIQMLAGDVVQLVECTPAYNYQEFEEKAASDFGPSFVGSTQASPGITFRSRQILTILTECDVENVAAGLHVDATPDPYTVRFFCRGGVPFGTRAADDAPTEHHVVDLVNSAFLTWDSINADQGSAAEISARLDVAAQADIQSQDPFVWTGSVPDPMPLSVLTQHVYTLGPIFLSNLGTGAATEVGGVTSARWENRIEREEQFSDGDPFPTYQGIRTMSPRLTFTTTNVGLLDLFIGSGKRGFLITNDLYFYLRRMSRAEIHEADSATQHIRFSMTTGLVTCRQLSNNPAELEITVSAYKTGLGQSFFTVVPGTTIVPP
jgi:hypothetical protein